MKKFLVMIASMFALATSASADVLIVVDKSQQLMAVETDTDSYVWEVSTGRKGYNTPTGVFKPYLMKPMHYSKKYDDAPMPFSIFFEGGYAIHATYDINRLGRPASHGCIRLAPQDAQWLYQIVSEYGKENTTILIQE